MSVLKYNTTREREADGGWRASENIKTHHLFSEEEKAGKAENGMQSWSEAGGRMSSPTLTNIHPRVHTGLCYTSNARWRKISIWRYCCAIEAVFPMCATPIFQRTRVMAWVARQQESTPASSSFQLLLTGIVEWAKEMLFITIAQSFYFK